MSDETIEKKQHVITDILSSIWTDNFGWNWLTVDNNLTIGFKIPKEFFVENEQYIWHFKFMDLYYQAGDSKELIYSIGDVAPEYVNIVQAIVYHITN